MVHWIENPFKTQFIDYSFSLYNAQRKITDNRRTILKWSYNQISIHLYLIFLNKLFIEKN